VQLSMMINTFLQRYGFNGKAIINARALKRAIVDYFVDIVRVKEFNSIEKTEREKNYAYMAYWLLRRKPILITVPFDGCEFLNEMFITGYLVSLSASIKKIANEDKARNPTFKKFQELLFYNLKYRPVSPQSLELMIEAFLAGFDFTSIVPASSTK
jgi:hypothetical protein